MATLKTDPTRTTLLRRSFIAEMNKRFRTLRGQIRYVVVELDVFGLKSQQHPFSTNESPVQNVEPREFEFQTNPQKLNSFKRWFEDQVEAGILTTNSNGDPWTAEYVQSAYRKGLTRAYTETHKTELAQSPDFYEGGKAQFLRDSFGAPESVQKVQLLATRSFEQLRGVTQTMAQQMNFILANALTRGDGPFEIARAMNQRIEGLTKQRARTIARTEVIHAHAEGQLDGYEKLGVEELGVMAEWSTAGDERVCVRCAAMEGEIFTVEEARGLIPLHPNCRCTWIPKSVDNKT